MRRRQVLALGAGLFALAAGCGNPVGSRRLSSTTISMVAPGPTGGDVDLVARTLKGVAEKESLTGGVEVVNRPLRTALTEFLRAGRPGQVLLARPAMVGTIRPVRQAHAFAGTTPLARLCGEWELLVVPSSSRLGTFGAFADAMRRAPDRLAVAGRAKGGVDHLLLGMLAQSLGVDPRLLHYEAYPTSDQAITALASGRVAAVLGSHAEVRERVRSGDVHVLAVSAPDRIDGLDAPTLLECDVHLYCADWRGLLGPGGLREDDRAALLDLCRGVAESARWQQQCARNGWEPLYLDGEELRQWLRVECRRLSRALEDLGVRV
ncbi:Bug family tripartite tricarboxylate transporter substrate binding protein [Sphaerisporangium fuscum]|uniref:Bug family tripartite tricarboxylate transporter substrate binding protein n=1 Tax=Sphaerisporangium fuscum TaxID=2835868 RepID=UPI001BDBFFDA|nr:tripartite tricarboxylate transporter substrate-binding protein [Sphaerisporangium fuscum]